MPQDARDLITWTLGSLVSLCILVGVATKFVLVPYLREHLFSPLRETHRQVSENGHTHHDTPTLPDRLEDLAVKVDDASRAHADQARDITALTRVMDEHLRWSDRWVDVVDRELELLKQRTKPNGDNQ